MLLIKAVQHLSGDMFAVKSVRAQPLRVEECASRSEQPLHVEECLRATFKCKYAAAVCSALISSMRDKV